MPVLRTLLLLLLGSGLALFLVKQELFANLGIPSPPPAMVHALGDWRSQHFSLLNPSGRLQQLHVKIRDVQNWRQGSRYRDAFNRVFGIKPGWNTSRASSSGDRDGTIRWSGMGHLVASPQAKQGYQ